MSHKPIILAVYENDTNMKMAADLLSKEGYTIYIEANLFSAVAMVAKQKIDMIILDLDGIGIKEMQFFDTAREINPNISILVSFSIENREKATKALEQGASSYILKPLSLSELYSVVKIMADTKQFHESSPHASEGVAFNHPEQELRQPLERLATRVAHEINNPLTTLSGHLQVLAENAEKNPQISYVYAIMEEEAQRIADIVKNLLTFAQPLESDQTLVDLNGLLAEVLNPLTKDELSKGIVVTKNFQADLPKIEANSKQLELSCRNIINNSKRSMQGKGKLEVTTKTHDCDLVQVSIKDSGVGISPKMLDHVFDPYYAVNNGGEEADLGLCVSYRVIKNHGGTLALDSKKGKGTTFTITLPVNNGSQPAGSFCNV